MSQHGQGPQNPTREELLDFLENAVVPLHRVGANGTILWANQAELDFLGYTRNEYIGHHISEFHYDQPVLKDILDTLACGKELQGRYARLRRKDGGLRTVRIYSNTYAPNGKFQHTRCFSIDVTQEVRAEEAQARLAAIVESSDDAIISEDLNGVITSWNRAATRIYGYEPHEIIGRNISTLIPPELHHEGEEILAKLRNNERIDHFETLRIRKDGERINVSLTISPIRNSMGQIIGASKIARDIRERKAAEMETWKAGLIQSKLAAIVESSDDAIISKDLTGTITSWNAAAERIFGWKAEEIVGKSVLTLIPPELHDQEPMILGKLSRGERIDHFETIRMRKDGTRIQVSLTVSPIRNNSGQVVGASKIVHDITKEKQADAALWRANETRARLAAIVESSDDAIISKDLNSIITSWNKAAERIFGYKAEEILGRSILLLMPPELRNEEPDILRKLTGGERVEHYETVRLRKDGSRIDVSIAVSPLRDAEGRIIGGSQIARDITQRKRSEVALRMAEKLASVGRMAATVSHEINNPLEAVVNLIYLSKQALSEKRIEHLGEFLAMAEQELSRVTHLTRQTLAFYRGGQEPQPTYMSKQLEHLISVFDSRLKNKDIDIGLQVRGEDEIMAIPSEMQQVFTNLLSNAIDAVGLRGRILIRVSRCKMRNRRGVRISVCDTGSGISREAMGKLFEPFFTTKKDVGTGLGLWVSKGIVEKMGGSLRVRTSTAERNHGSVFSVVLPANEIRHAKNGGELAMAG